MEDRKMIDLDNLSEKVIEEFMKLPDAIGKAAFEIFSEEGFTAESYRRVYVMGIVDGFKIVKQIYNKYYGINEE